jgi:transposase
MGTRVVLTDEQRGELERFVSTGIHPARIVRRARVILALDASNDRIPMTQACAAQTCGVSKVTVANIKHDFEKGGLSSLLSRKKRQSPPVPAKVDGEFEAHLIALSCTDPPAGYGRWSVRLLADKSVELGYIDSISHMTVSRVLKKTNSSLT